MRTTKDGRSYSERLELGCRLRGIKLEIRMSPRRHNSVTMGLEGEEPQKFGSVAQAWEHYVEHYARLPVGIQ